MDKAELKRAADKARHAAVHARRRLGALTAYGLGCVCCGEREIAFLTIDHVISGVPESPRGGTTFYRWLEKNAYPVGFQTLCFNCNDGKHHRPHCPHQVPVVPVTSGTKWFRELKLDVLNAYGGKCACCDEDGPDFLHLDHVNGGGQEHRNSLTGRVGHGAGGPFYTNLRKMGYPNDPPLRVLCANCNHATRLGACPHERVKEVV